jgi:hypothetical protein
MLRVIFWIVPGRVVFNNRRFGTLCLFHLHRLLNTIRRGTIQKITRNKMFILILSFQFQEFVESPNGHHLSVQCWYGECLIARIATED